MKHFPEKELFWVIFFGQELPGYLVGILGKNHARVTIINNNILGHFVMEDLGYQKAENFNLTHEY